MRLGSFAEDAQSLLADFATQLESQGVDVPRRQYIAAGNVAWDDSSLTLRYFGIEQGQPGRPQATTFPGGGEAATYFVALWVQLARRIKGIPDYASSDAEVGMPNAATLNKDGVTVFTDGAALVLAAQEIYATYKATDPGMGFVIGPLASAGPDGGMVSTSLQLHLSLD